MSHLNPVTPKINLWSILMNEKTFFGSNPLLMHAFFALNIIRGMSELRCSDFCVVSAGFTLKTRKKICLGTNSLGMRHIL